MRGTYSQGYGAGKRWHRKELTAASEQLRQAREELSQIRVAAAKHLDGMDRAGGDRDGMPECPWCHRPDEGTGHDADCGLVALREAIFPAPGPAPHGGEGGTDHG